MVVLSTILARITGVPHTFDGPYLVCAEPGGEPYIDRWDVAVLGPQPSEEQIEFVRLDIEKEEAENSIREERNNRLAKTDFMMMSDYPLTEDKKTELIVYRQSLRDITKQSTFPDEVVWPVLE